MNAQIAAKADLWVSFVIVSFRLQSAREISLTNPKALCSSSSSAISVYAAKIVRAASSLGRPRMTIPRTFFTVSMLGVDVSSVIVFTFTFTFAQTSAGNAGQTACAVKGQSPGLGLRVRAAREGRCDAIDLG